MGRVQEESASLLYAMRAMMILMGAGIGLEAAMQMISRGGYGIISVDFKNCLANLQKGARLEEEFSRMGIDAATSPYKRFLSTLRNNVASDTDLVRALDQQAEREEEERNDKLKSYITSLESLPTLLLTIGILSPIIFGIIAMLPVIAPDMMVFLDTSGTIATLASCFGPVLLFTAILLGLLGYKAHSSDPGVI